MCTLSLIFLSCSVPEHLLHMYMHAHPDPLWHDASVRTERNIWSDLKSATSHPGLLVAPHIGPDTALSIVLCALVLQGFRVLLTISCMRLLVVLHAKCAFLPPPAS